MWCDQIWGFIKQHSTVPGAVVLFATTYVLALAMDAGAAGAAWVQAVGSVAAICAAIWISKWQEVQQRRSLIREQKDYMEMAFGIGAHAAVTVDGAVEAIKNNSNESNLRFQVRLLNAALGDMNQIDIGRLAHNDFIIAWMDLKRNVLLSASSIETNLPSVSFNHIQVGRWAVAANNQSQGMSNAIISFVEQHPFLLDEME
jgi:hypothetical protein